MVDDLFIFSKALCEVCLANGVRTLWPTDIEAVVEASSAESSSFTFLHVGLQFLEEFGDCPIEVTPELVNMDFLIGKVEIPHSSRVCPYAGSLVHRREHIQQSIWCRIAMFGQIHRGTLEHAIQSLAYIVAEPLPLG